MLLYQQTAAPAILWPEPMELIWQMQSVGWAPVSRWERPDITLSDQAFILFRLWFCMHPFKRSHKRQGKSPFQLAGIKVYTRTSVLPISACHQAEGLFQIVKTPSSVRLAGTQTRPSEQAAGGRTCPSTSSGHRSGDRVGARLFPLRRMRPRSSGVKRQALT